MGGPPLAGVGGWRPREALGAASRHQQVQGGPRPTERSAAPGRGHRGPWGPMGSGVPIPGDCGLRARMMCGGRCADTCPSLLPGHMCVCPRNTCPCTHTSTRASEFVSVRTWGCVPGYFHPGDPVCLCMSCPPRPICCVTGAGPLCRKWHQ